MCNRSSSKSLVFELLGSLNESQPRGAIAVWSGAQIVSCIADDRRIGGHTFTAFKRCAISAVENDVDLINYSAGGDVSEPNGNPWAQIVGQLVHESQIVFCSAAGNSGPALSTMDNPGECQRQKN